MKNADEAAELEMANKQGMTQEQMEALLAKTSSNTTLTRQISTW
jgi:hypothetical protein